MDSSRVQAKIPSDSDSQKLLTGLAALQSSTNSTTEEFLKKAREQLTDPAEVSALNKLLSVLAQRDTLAISTRTPLSTITNKMEMKKEPTLAKQTPSRQPPAAATPTRSAPRPQIAAGVGQPSSSNASGQQNQLQGQNVSSPKADYLEAVQRTKLYRKLEIDMLNKNHLTIKKIKSQMESVNFKIDESTAKIKSSEAMAELASLTGTKVQLSQADLEKERAKAEGAIELCQRMIINKTARLREISQEKQELIKDLEMSVAEEKKHKKHTEKQSAEQRSYFAERDHLEKQLEQAKAKFAEDKANLDAVKEDTPKVKELAAGLKKTYQSKDGQEEAPLQDKENLKRRSTSPLTTTSKMQKTTDTE